MRKILPVLMLLLLLSSCSTKTPTTELTPGNDTISLGEDYTAAACMLVTDEGKYQMKETSNDTDTSKLGTYTVIYNYTYEDTQYSCQRKVFVTDHTAPTVSLIEGVDTVYLNNDWTDMSVSYSDNYDTDLTLTTMSDVDTSKLGTYIVTYTVTDSSGNIGTALRYVHVIQE